MRTASNILRMMRAAQVPSLGSPDKVISVSSYVPVPLSPKDGQLTIAVQACSLSPNDLHIVTGVADFVKKPKSFPYTPGGDIAGTVVAIAKDGICPFGVGERVVATSSCIPLNGLAQFANIDTSLCRRLPDNVSYIDGAALANSTVSAVQALDAASLLKRDSVLVLGGSGGVGTAVTQLLRNRHVAHITVTSSDERLMKGLGAHAVVNYRKEPWWNSKTIREHAPFDVIIDCAEGVSAWEHCREDQLIKPGAEGGRFVALVWNDWAFEIHNVWQMFGHIGPVIKRMASSCWNKRNEPTYKCIFPGPHPDILERVIDLAGSGQIQPVIDGREPFPFTTEGIRDAFLKLEQRQAHGKIVVTIGDDS